MDNETILRDFIDQVWNKKDIDSVERFVNPEYTIYIDTGDPWEGKTLNNDEWVCKLNCVKGFGSFN